MKKNCVTCSHYLEESGPGTICGDCDIYSNWKSDEDRLDVLKDIGLPATLELCAEECVELAHAVLKMARKLRDENPTPKSMHDILDSVIEEIGDVQVCIEKLLEEDIIPKKDVESVITYKRNRWEKRLKERKRIDKNEHE